MKPLDENETTYLNVYSEFCIQHICDAKGYWISKLLTAHPYLILNFAKLWNFTTLYSNSCKKIRLSILGFELITTMHNLQTSIVALDFYLVSLLPQLLCLSVSCASLFHSFWMSDCHDQIPLTVLVWGSSSDFITQAVEE